MGDAREPIRIIVREAAVDFGGAVADGAVDGGQAVGVVVDKADVNAGPAAADADAGRALDAGEAVRAIVEIVRGVAQAVGGGDAVAEDVVLVVERHARHAGSALIVDAGEAAGGVIRVAVGRIGVARGRQLAGGVVRVGDR